MSRFTLNDKTYGQMSLLCVGIAFLVFWGVGSIFAITGLIPILGDYQKTPVQATISALHFLLSVVIFLTGFIYGLAGIINDEKKTKSLLGLFVSSIILIIFVTPFIVGNS